MNSTHNRNRSSPLFNWTVNIYSGIVWRENDLVFRTFRQDKCYLVAIIYRSIVIAVFVFTKYVLHNTSDKGTCFGDIVTNRVSRKSGKIGVWERTKQVVVWLLHYQRRGAKCGSNNNKLLYFVIHQYLIVLIVVCVLIIKNVFGQNLLRGFSRNESHTFKEFFVGRDTRQLLLFRLVFVTIIRRTTS